MGQSGPGSIRLTCGGIGAAVCCASVCNHGALKYGTCSHDIVTGGISKSWLGSTTNYATHFYNIYTFLTRFTNQLCKSQLCHPKEHH